MTSSNAKQTTLASPVEASGLGLHTAVPVTVRLMPAPPETGYVFRRTDLGGFEIPATVESVAHCSYATTLMRTGVMLSTVEHLLAALRGCGIDNAIVLTKEGMLNETSLRFTDEFVRHKILDIVGDLALLGMTVLGRVTAMRSGHMLHAALMSSLLKKRAAWEIVDVPASELEPVAVAAG